MPTLSFSEANAFLHSKDMFPNCYVLNSKPARLSEEFDKANAQKMIVSSYSEGALKRQKYNPFCAQFLRELFKLETFIIHVKKW